MRIQRRVASIIVTVIGVVFSLQSAGQAALSGTPPFSTIAANGVDSVNLGDLNVHLTLPILSKAGRGIPFSFSLNYDSNFWHTNYTGSAWTPAFNFGWNASNLGNVTSTASQGSLCPPPSGNIHENNLSNFIYTDPNNTPHLISGTAVDGSMCDTIYLRNAVGTATDGSGYSLWFIPNSDGTQSWYVTDPAGTTVSTNNLIQDRNGNQIMAGTSFVDTLGSTVLTQSGSYPTITYTYTGPSGSKSVVVSYLSHTVRTNFGGSYVVNSVAYPIAQYNSTAYLPDKITYADGTYYQFTYEATNGYPGAVTGRLASVRLPTGGTISYTYGDGVTVTSYGAPVGLTRVSPDGPWQYIASPGLSGSGTWLSNTNITDPVGNTKTITFTIGPDGGYYKTSEKNKQGSSTTLRTTLTCYNGSTPPPCDGLAITLPISKIATYVESSDSTGVVSETVTTGGLFPTEIDNYDFGAVGSGSPGALLRQTKISYSIFHNNYNGSFQKPSQVSVYDGSANLKSQTTYGYDESAVVSTSGTPSHVAAGSARGNLTSVKRLVSGTTNLTWSSTYFDTGLVDVVTDPNGSQTAYTYGACGNSFPTHVAVPLGLARSMTWNCTGAVQSSLSDENNKTSYTGYTDPYLWRPNSTTDASGNVTSITYPSATQVESALAVVSGVSAFDQLATTDSLGRPFIAQQRKAPGSSSFDSVQTTYDSLGRIATDVLPYQGGGGQSATSPVTVKAAYDGLDRVTQVTDAGGGTATRNYTENDVLVTVGPAPSGENAKRRQFEYDALGRIKSVCEITASGGGGCGQNNAQTGYLTRYTYDPLGNLLTVQQNAQGSPVQTRSFTYDGLGRKISETTPESGTKTYAYDSDLSMCGNGAYTSNGDLVKTVDAAGNCVMRYYDQLHRLTDVGNSNQAVSHCKRFRYDNSGGYPGSTQPAGLANTLGRLVEAATDKCDNTGDAIITDEWFSYTARGEISDVYESTPHSGGYYHLTANYWPHGMLKQLSGLNAVPTLYYGASDGSGLDGEGRLTKVSAASGQNPVTGVTYDPNTATLSGVTYGSGDFDLLGYDPNTLRLTSFSTTIGSPAQTASYGLTTNANGSLQKLVISDPFNSANSQTCNYAYDDLERVTAATCGSAWQQTFQFDPFGNIDKSGNQSFMPGYDKTTNRINGGGYSTTYDANGNELSDGIVLQTYTWNADSNPITINGAGTTTVIYDAIGRTVESQNGSNTEILYGPSGSKLALMNGSSLVKAFIPLPGNGTAVYNSSGLAYYRHADWLGSSRLASTASRTVYFSGAYAPYGEGYALTGTSDLSFTGQNQDTMPNLYDFQFRRYSSVQSRWISPDPAGEAAADLSNPQSWNRYAYVQNNPNSNIDPFGLVCSAPFGRGGDSPCNPGNYGIGFGVDGGDDEFQFVNSDVVDWGWRGEDAGWGFYYIGADLLALLDPGSGNSPDPAPNQGKIPDKKSCAARLAAGVQKSTGMPASNLQQTGTVGGHANYSFDVTDPSGFQDILNKNMPWSWAGPLDEGHRYGTVMSTHILDSVNGSYSGHTDLFSGHSILAPLHWLVDVGIGHIPGVNLDFGCKAGS